MKKNLKYTMRLLAVMFTAACTSPTATQCTKPLYTTTYYSWGSSTTCQMIVVPCPGSSQKC